MIFCDQNNNNYILFWYNNYNNNIIIIIEINIIIIYNTQMVAVAFVPWTSHSEDRAEP